MNHKFLLMTYARTSATVINLAHHLYLQKVFQSTVDDCRNPPTKFNKSLRNTVEIPV